MGRYGFKSGYVEAQNMEAGTVEIESGDDGSKTVSFDEPMQGTPAVVITPTESEQTGYVPAATTDSTGFTVEGDDGVYHYIAMDSDRRSE